MNDETRSPETLPLTADERRAHELAEHIAARLLAWLRDEEIPIDPTTIAGVVNALALMTHMLVLYAVKQDLLGPDGHAPVWTPPSRTH